MKQKHPLPPPSSPSSYSSFQDLESLDNPAKDKDYGHDKALQYGVSSVSAGPSNQFFSTDTRVVFGINALEIGLVELYDMGFKRYEYYHFAILHVECDDIYVEHATIYAELVLGKVC